MGLDGERSSAAPLARRLSLAMALSTFSFVVGAFPQVFVDGFGGGARGWALIVWWLVAAGLAGSGVYLVLPVIRSSSTPAPRALRVVALLLCLGVAAYVATGSLMLLAFAWLG